MAHELLLEQVDFFELLHGGGGGVFDDAELELLELALGVEELDELEELDEVIDEEL